MTEKKEGKEIKKLKLVDISVKTNNLPSASISLKEIGNSLSTLELELELLLLVLLLLLLLLKLEIILRIELELLFSLPIPLL